MHSMLPPNKQAFYRISQLARIALSISLFLSMVEGLLGYFGSFFTFGLPLGPLCAMLFCVLALAHDGLERIALFSAALSFLVPSALNIIASYSLQKDGPSYLLAYAQPASILLIVALRLFFLWHAPKPFSAQSAAAACTVALFAVAYTLPILFAICLPAALYESIGTFLSAFTRIGFLLQYLHILQLAFLFFSAAVKMRIPSEA